MSEKYLTEICESSFKHHPMTVLDKNYCFDSHHNILCSECVPHWIENQSRSLAVTVRFRLHAINNVLDKLFDHPDSKIELDVEEKIFSTMRTVIKDSIHVHIDGWAINLPSEESEESPKLGLKTKLTFTLGNSFRYVFPFDYYSYLDEEYPDTVILHWLADRFSDILTLYFQANFMTLSTQEVLMITESKKERYNSEAVHHHHHHKRFDKELICCKCGTSLEGQTHYIYNNNIYCVDDMYSIVVKAAVDTNLSEIVGLANPDENEPASHRITDTEEFKCSVIDKYFNYMNNFAHIYHVHKCTDEKLMDD